MKFIVFNKQRLKKEGEAKAFLRVLPSEAAVRRYILFNEDEYSIKKLTNKEFRSYLRRGNLNDRTNKRR